MNELWIGIVEVLTDPSPTSGNTRAFTNVVTWADSTATFLAMVTEVFTKYGWMVLSTENIRTVASQSDYDSEIVEIIEQAKANPIACIYATFHYYPSKVM